MIDEIDSELSPMDAKRMLAGLPKSPSTANPAFAEKLARIAGINPDESPEVSLQRTVQAVYNIDNIKDQTGIVADHPTDSQSLGRLQLANRLARETTTLVRQVRRQLEKPRNQ